MRVAKARAASAWSPATTWPYTCIVKAAARRANLQRTVHAHLFRHGYAINFLNCSGRLDALQEQLGHRDINTTRIYLRLSDEDVKREVGKVR